MPHQSCEQAWFVIQINGIILVCSLDVDSIGLNGGERSFAREDPDFLEY